MVIVAILICTFGLATASGATCGDISGTWQNELGSRMNLYLDASNRISGEYYTAVQTKPGAAAYVSNITGLFSKQNDGALLAFSVLFNRGYSLTSWVGQCVVCNGKQVLYTTYTFRKYVTNPNEKWASNVVYQNAFQRIEDIVENVIGIGDTAAKIFSPLKSMSLISNEHSGGLDLKGKWKSNDDQEIDILRLNGDVLEGKHQTTDVIGRKDGTDVFTSVALMSMAGKKVKSWTGIISNVASPHVLETSWLEHEFISSCPLARNMVRIGTQNFIRVALESENIVKKSETFLDKLRRFFSSMF